jgi:hypothetical protein
MSRDSYMDFEILNRIAAAHEKVVEKRFKKLNYSVKKLDSKKSKRPRPDWLVSNSSGPQILCEVKTVFSAGYLQDKNIYVSTHEQGLCNFGVIESKIDLTKINDCLSDAVHKRSALVFDHSSFTNLPLLVAFFFDAFADFLPFYPRTMDQDISGILTIEIDATLTKKFEKLSVEEQELRLRTGFAAGLPPNSKGFVLVRNKIARRRVPRDFQLRCHIEGYDESNCCRDPLYDDAGKVIQTHDYKGEFKPW